MSVVQKLFINVSYTNFLTQMQLIFIYGKKHVLFSQNVTRRNYFIKCLIYKNVKVGTFWDIVPRVVRI
jgi:hypothetical protein